MFHKASQDLAQQAVAAATVGTLALAGTPALVELCYDVTAGHVDTHVLMTLAVMGTIAMGAASEVQPHMPLQCFGKWLHGFNPCAVQQCKKPCLQSVCRPACLRQ